MENIENETLTLNDVFEMVKSPFESGNLQGRELAKEILSMDYYSAPSLCTWQFGSENDELKKTIFNIWKNRICTLSEKEIYNRIAGCYYEESVQLFQTLNSIPDMEIYDESIEKSLQEQFPNAYPVFSPYKYCDGVIQEITSYDIPESNKASVRQHVLSISMRGTCYNEFLNAFITECDKQNVPYYINVGETKPDEHTRSYFNDNIQLIASDEMLPAYVQIIKKIVSKNPEFRSEASHPIEVFGLIDGWIGYYSDIGYDGDGVYSKLAYGLVNLSEARAIQKKFIEAYYPKKSFVANKYLPMTEYIAQLMTEEFLIDKGYYGTNHSFFERRIKKYAEKHNHETEVFEKFLGAINEILANIGIPEGIIDTSVPARQLITQYDYLKNRYCMQIELSDIIQKLWNDQSVEELKNILAEKGYYKEKPCFLQETVERINPKETELTTPVNELGVIEIPTVEEVDFNLKDFDVKDPVEEIKTWEEIQDMWLEKRVDVPESKPITQTYTIQVFTSDDPTDLRLFIHENDADLFNFVPVLKPYLNYYPITSEELDAYSIKPIYRNDLELPKKELTIEVLDREDSRKYYLKDSIICETELQAIKIEQDQVRGVDIEIPLDIVELYSLYYDVKLVPKLGTTEVGESPKTLGLNFGTSSSIKESSC